MEESVGIKGGNGPREKFMQCMVIGGKRPEATTRNVVIGIPDFLTQKYFFKTDIPLIMQNILSYVYILAGFRHRLYV